MNGKGIFCFLLLLAFFALEAGFSNRAVEAGQLLSEGKATAFESESTFLARALVENSVDQAIEESLKQGLALNLEASQLKGYVNSRLAILFGKMEKKQNPGISLAFSKQSLDQEFLNKNSVVVVESLSKKQVKAEYTYTAGLMKNEPVVAEISSLNSRHVFMLPAGYTVKAVVIG